MPKSYPLPFEQYNKLITNISFTRKDLNKSQLDFILDNKIIMCPKLIIERARQFREAGKYVEALDLLLDYCTIIAYNVGD